MTSSGPSQLTLYRPREVSFAGSSRMTTDFITVLLNIEREKWPNRRQLFFKTLSFCLTLANVWRFPKEVMLHGHGAFLWLYVTFTFIIGSSLLYFEVALGQHSGNGFLEAFTMCPIFEGIIYSVGFYCITVAIFYNMLNVFSVKYAYYSFYQILPYAECKYSRNYCLQDSKNQSFSPEGVFFEKNFIQFFDGGESRHINWSVILILFFLWASICFALIKGVRTYSWLIFMFCLLLFFVLIAILFVTCFHEGANQGITAFFVPTLSAFLDPTTWKFAFEQTLVTLGLGMGLLVTVGSLSQFKDSIHIDSFVVSLFVLISSVLSGTTFFGIVGILAKERGETMDTVLKVNGKYEEDIHVHVIFSQLFSRMSYGGAQFLSFLFYCTFAFVGMCSITAYAEIYTTVLYSFKPFPGKYKIYANIGVCCFCFSVSCALANTNGYSLMRSLDKCFLGVSLGILVLCEMVAFVYIYGVFDICDDLEFVVGFYPNIFYQITWICTPIALMILMVFDVYRVFSTSLNAYDACIYVIILIFILGPIIVRGLCVVCIYYKDGDVGRACYPRDDLRTLPQDNIFTYPAHKTYSDSRLNSLVS